MKPSPEVIRIAIGKARKDRGDASQYPAEECDRCGAAECECAEESEDPEDDVESDAEGGSAADWADLVESGVSGEEAQDQIRMSPATIARLKSALAELESEDEYGED
jgi:ribonucleotide monophosphatase NagD (HAD superfamily)